MAFNAVGIVGGQAVGTGVGGGITSVIEPILRDLTNEAWERYKSMPVSALAAANLVAAGERSYAWGLGEAQKNGVNDDRFQALVDLADTAPDLATLLDLRRRNLITPDDFTEGAKKGQIEPKWIAALLALTRRLLTPAELANAVVQGFRDFDGAAESAERLGVSRDDFQTMVDTTGLPPGPETLQQWARRGIITEAELAQGIREGHTKTKYVDEYIETLQQVLTAGQWASLWLRGWVTEAQAKAGGALTGYDAAAMDLLYLNQGRPATTRQVHIGWARGGRLPGAASEREAFETAVRNSNIRTEYIDLLWSQRFTYPSAFVLRALAADGTFTRDQTEQVLIESGWNPQYAALAADKWAATDEAGPKAKWADRARSRLFTVAHNEYLDNSITVEQARQVLGQIGALDPEQDAIIRLWDTEETINRLELTPAQIKKAYKAARWTQEQAIDALEAKEMTREDADTFLQS